MFQYIHIQPHKWLIKPDNRNGSLKPVVLSPLNPLYMAYMSPFWLVNIPSGYVNSLLLKMVIYSGFSH